MTPSLTHYNEFQEILTHYHLAPTAKEELADLKLVLLIGPSSTGRNTIIRHLVASGRYHYIISDTTRPPRVNDGVIEENGREYWFKSEEEVLADLRAGQYLEAEIIHGQQVSGISIRELQKAKEQNLTAIADVDLQGMQHIMKLKPTAIALMLLPPSYDEWQRRLASRGRMSEQERLRRMETAYKIFSEGTQQPYYRFVIAENVAQSASIIDSLGRGGPNPHQDRGAQLVRNLHDELRQKLYPI